MEDIEKLSFTGIRSRIRMLTDYFVRFMWNQTQYETVREWEKEDDYVPRAFNYVWMTNFDDRVCPICEPLHGEKFTQNQMDALEFPAHHACRCWIDTQAVTER